MKNRGRAWRVQGEMCQLYMYLQEYFRHRDEGNRVVMQACLMGARDSVRRISKAVRENQPDNIVNMPRRVH